MVMRTKPNILITGTPCVGKSTLSKKIASKYGLNWINVSKYAIQNKLCMNYDDIQKCWILEPEKLVHHLKGTIRPGGCIVEYHSCDFFPEKWFDGVFVLRTNNTLLYDRLVAKGQSGNALKNNIECEVFQCCLEEANENYVCDVIELQSNTWDDYKNNLNTIKSWIEKY